MKSFIKVSFIMILLFSVLFPQASFVEAASNKNQVNLMMDKKNAYVYKSRGAIQTYKYLKTKDGWEYWKMKDSNNNESVNVFRQDKSGLHIGWPNSNYLTVVQSPIKVGTTWKEGFDGEFIKYKIKSTNRTVKTPAGTFKKVIEVVGSHGYHYYYAPNVGDIKTTYKGKTISELTKIIKPSKKSIKTTTAYIDIGSGYLNVRDGASKKSKVVGKLKKYSKVQVYGKTKNGWSEIRYKNKKAYIYSKYLTNVNLKNTRKKYNLKDSNGKKYTLYVIGNNENKRTASWDDVWAGVNIGDTLYTGNYKLYIKKVGSQTIKYTGYQYKNHTYNATRKMIYSIPTKSKGQPDLFAVASSESTNFESADLYFIQKGKLKKAASVWYTHRLQRTGKNTFRTALYDNSEWLWYESGYKLDTKNGKLKEISSKSYKNSNRFKNWRKDWK